MKLPRLTRFWPWLAVFGLLLSFVPAGQGQAQKVAPDDPNVVLYKTGMAAFGKGDFEAASTNLEQCLKNIGGNDVTLEAAYYNLAVSYYNLQRFEPAAAAFKAYREKYPKGTRVTEATLSLANSYIGTKNYAAALPELHGLASNPALHDQVLFLEGSILIQEKKPVEAIKVLEELTHPTLRSSLVVRGALMLASIYIERSDFSRADVVVLDIQNHLDLVDNILRFNGLIIDLGDKLLTQGFYPQALHLYRIARTRKDVIRYQKERIDRMQRTVEENTARFRATKDPTNLASNQFLATAITEGRQTLDDMQKGPDFEPGLFLRMARAYQQDDKPLEAALIYRRIVDKYPAGTTEREPALFGLVSAFTDLGKPKRALDATDLYLQDFPQGPNASPVAYLRGAMALDAGDYAQAVTYFGSALAQQPESDFRDRMSFLTGTAQLLGGDPAAALVSYQKYLTDFPGGDFVEEANYRIGLAQLFSDQYEAARSQFHSYLKNYPQGAFMPDVLYRLAVIKYAAQDYAGTTADCTSWLHDHPGQPEACEVYGLLGDAQAAVSSNQPAVDAYVSSYQAAVAIDNDEVLNYSLFAAGKLLGKMGQWEKVASLFEDFTNAHPDHRIAPAAVASIIQARARLGQVDLAKGFAAQTIARFIADPTRDAVENLLTQLAGLCARKRQPGVDPAAELDKLLTFPPAANVPASATVRARRTFAKAELMTALRKPQEHDALLLQLATEAKPADLPPLLLGQAGEALLAKGQTEPAEAMFTYLKAAFPKSDVLDYAYVGLGDIAARAGDRAQALTWYSKAVDDYPSMYRMKEATLGKARTLLALDRLDEAAKLFEQVASVKEWRGEATVQALCALGDIEVKKADYAKAIGYYQRVYVAYQKFPVWVARAYIDSARAFEKLGKNDEAINTYREMIRNEKIAGLAEVQEARKRLTELGQG